MKGIFPFAAHRKNNSPASIADHKLRTEENRVNELLEGWQLTITATPGAAGIDKKLRAKTDEQLKLAIDNLAVIYAGQVLTGGVITYPLFANMMMLRRICRERQFKNKNIRKELEEYGVWESSTSTTSTPPTASATTEVVANSTTG